MILDYLPVPELMHFAQTSRRMQEMVYDDTRWVQKLRTLGCWKEAEARQRFEEGLRRKQEAQRAREAEETRRTGVGVGVNGSGGGGGRERKASITLFDAGWEEQKQQRVAQRQDNGALRSPLGSGHASDRHHISWRDVFSNPATALDVFQRVQSIRGFARQEYAKIYAALAPFYLDLVRARSHTDPVLFRAFRDPEDQAKMLAQLKVFAKGDECQGWQQRTEKLDSMMSIFENAVLREFEQGCEANDVDGRMRRYAHVLVALNGGVAGIDSFIHNNRIMLEKERFGNPLDCVRDATDGQYSLAYPFDFFQSLSVALNEQVGVMDRVFPPSVDVLLPFFDRVGEDVVTEYITPLFDEAHGGSLESYLKLVAGVYEQGLRFVQSIKPSTGSTSDFAEKARAIINRSFEPHVDLYLQEELDFFKQQSTAEVDTWEKQLSEREATAESFFMANVNRQAAKQDFLTSFKKVLLMPVNAMPFSSSKTSGQETPANVDPLEAAANNLSLDPVVIEKQQPGGPTTELAAKAAIMNSKLEGIGSLFSLEVALNLVHASKTSIERAALFTQLGAQSGGEAKEQCEAIFIHLLQILGFRHVKPGFDKAVGHLTSYSARDADKKKGHTSNSNTATDGVRPLVMFLELVNVGDLIQQMVDVFYAQELVAPRLTDRDDFLNPAVKEKKRFEQMLDERVAAGLNKGIDVLIDEVEYICASTQATTDYNPTGGAPSSSSTSASNAAFDIGPTPTATRVIALVSSHTSLLAGSTDKNTLDVFNTEVGLRLFASLCKHLKRQRISADAGAIKLIADTNAYFALASSLRNKELLRYFAALRALAHIFLVEGKGHAKEIAQLVADADRYGGVFRAEEVLEFAERRADWFGVRREVEKAMFGIGCVVM